MPVYLVDTLGSVSWNVQLLLYLLHAKEMGRRGEELRNTSPVKENCGTVGVGKNLRNVLWPDLDRPFHRASHQHGDASKGASHHVSIERKTQNEIFDNFLLTIRLLD